MKHTVHGSTFFHKEQATSVPVLCACWISTLKDPTHSAHHGGSGVGRGKNVTFNTFV